MTYLLNLPLPLWLMLLPLGIAALLAAKYYQSQGKLQKQKAQQGKEVEAAIQNFKIEELMQQRKELVLALQSAQERAKDMTAKLNKAESEALKREALIVQLQTSISLESEILQERIKDKNAVISERDAQIEQLQSKLQLSELAHNETKADNEGLEIQFKDALSVINRTKRAQKQWDKICKEKAIKLLNTTIEAVKQKQANGQDAMLHRMNEIRKAKSETVVHDSIGVLRVFQADQSESVNNRHIVALCDEVNRGIAEQAQRINEELASVVDMSALQEGDTVKFRNNTFDQIDRIQKCNTDFDYKLNFADGTVGVYMKDGSYHKSETPNMNQWDIIQIIKPAKPEVNFEPQEGELVVYKYKVYLYQERLDNGDFIVYPIGHPYHKLVVAEIAPVLNLIYKNGFEKIGKRKGEYQTK